MACGVLEWQKSRKAMPVRSAGKQLIGLSRPGTEQIATLCRSYPTRKKDAIEISDTSNALMKGAHFWRLF
jgi:hypothetical protein